MMLQESTLARWFSPLNAFDSRLTVVVVIIMVSALVLSIATTLVLFRLGKISTKLHIELKQRNLTWLVLLAVIGIPILFGAFWTIGIFLVISILCYREFARATGLFRDKQISLAVVIAIMATMFAALDHWEDLFTSMTPLAITAIALVALLRDQPKGYLQRTALATLAFLLFGVCLGHLAFLANAVDYRPHLLLLIFAVEMNDIYAFISGKLFGRRKLIPNTSPNKTIAGAIGAMILTTITFVLLAQILFAGSALANFTYLILLGLLLSFAGQAGDLIVSSIKRDLGLKDMGTMLPGHGGLLDRFDSLLLAAPVYFHFVGYVVGFDWDSPARVFTGGG